MIKKLLLTLTICLFLTTPALCEDKTIKAVKDIEYTNVPSLEVVARPNEYLNKDIKIIAIFNKFSTLGLDYKPAFRDSKEYISFLIKRDDVKKHTIPLSELKIFIKRKKAEKLIDLESGDKIEIKGKVFSTALGDTWMDATEVKILEAKKKKKAEDKK